MDKQILLTIIASIETIVVAVIGGLFIRESRRNKKAHEKAEAQAALRAEEGLLSMKLTSASVNLGVATAIAIRDGKTNGEICSALREAGEAEKDYQDFIKRVATRQIVKG